MTQAYPLAWPLGKPRTPWKKRLPDRFKAGEKKITMTAAFDRLQDQVDRLGGENPILSSNIELTIAGRPRADRSPPDDPGVCLYFNMKGKPYAMACDTFRSVEQNIAAIAAHLEATRRIEVYGVATMAEALAAFQALPAPPDWRKTLGMPSVDGPGAPRPTPDIVNTYWKAACIKASREGRDLTDINVARDRALEELKNG